MEQTQPRSGGRSATFAANALFLIGALLLFLIIRAQGEMLSPPSVANAAPAAVGGSSAANPLLQVLMAMAVVIGSARAAGWLLHRFGQPMVMGEIIGGVLLGPSLLGRVAPDLASTIFPATVAPFLSVIAQLGVILYMFLVGLEFDLGIARRRGGAILAISQASMVVPFLLGSVVALSLFTRLAGPGVPSFTSFALFFGVSMSVTAFPVLARILTDQGVSVTPMGRVALACAAINDVAAWCLLALAVSTAQAKPESALLTFFLTFGYVGLMLTVGRWLLGRASEVLDRRGQLGEGGVAVASVGVLLSALTTEVIGVHAIFGAFLIGTVIPADSRIAKDLTARMETVVRAMFLPAFFAYTGLRTEIGLLSSVDDWLLCGLIILIATIGKLGGAAISARLSGLTSRDSAALGVLMNTRGLVELIVLNIGLDLHILSPTLFTMLVVMALVTTFATTPLFRWITRAHPWTVETAPRPS